jgi:hypothetical protein
VSISATSPFSANGILGGGVPIQHVTAAQMQAGVDPAAGPGSGPVYSPWQMMTPSDVQLFTAATGFTMEPDGQLLDANGNPAGNTPAAGEAEQFALALGGSALSSGQSVTVTGLQQIATAQADAGFALDPTMVTKGVAYLEQQESGGTGQTINAYV